MDWQDSTIVTIVVPGTEWKNWESMYRPDSGPMKNIARTFGGQPVLFEWPGGNSRVERQEAAGALSHFIRERCSPGAVVSLVGFSHGGNVAVLATQSVGVDHLVTIATPVLSAYQPVGVRHHLHIYNPHDPIQVWGGESVDIPGRGMIGPAGRTFSGASNIAVPIAEGNAAARHGDLLYRAETWDHIQAYLKKCSSEKGLAGPARMR